MCVCVGGGGGGMGREKEGEREREREVSKEIILHHLLWSKLPRFVLQTPCYIIMRLLSSPQPFGHLLLREP